MAKKRLLTSTQVADELGLNRRTIARYVTEGWITPDVITPGGQYRFDHDKVREQLRQVAEERRNNPDFRVRVKQVLGKIRAQATKDYLVHPALSGPSFLPTVAANATANLVRNLWTHSVIMCGHFPEGVETFERQSIEGETRGEWYLRQMLGSANISGSPAMHLMTGNLSFQIEHHLFPDLPSNRYQEIAPKVQEIFERYELTYTTGPLPTQVASAWLKIIRLSLPNELITA